MLSSSKGADDAILELSTITGLGLEMEGVGRGIAVPDRAFFVLGLATSFVAVERFWRVAMACVAVFEEAVVLETERVG